MMCSIEIMTKTVAKSVFLAFSSSDFGDKKETTEPGEISTIIRMLTIEMWD